MAMTNVRPSEVRRFMNGAGLDCIITTKQCSICGYVFSRFGDTVRGTDSFEPRHEQQVCPKCQKPVFVDIVRHPDEREL